MKKTLLIAGAFLIVQVIVGVAVSAVAMVSALKQGQPVDINTVSSPDVLLVSLLVSDVLIIIATILIRRRGWGSPFRWRMARAKGVIVCALALLGMVAVSILCEAANEAIGLPDTLEDFFQLASLSPLALWVLALFGPVAEEVTFRYGIVGSLSEEKRIPDWAILIVSALLFSVLHMNPAQMLPAFIAGLYLGWLYLLTGSLWPPILCHILNNVAGVISLRLANGMPSEEQTLAYVLGDDVKYIGALVGCAVVLALTIITLTKIMKIKKTL